MPIVITYVEQLSLALRVIEVKPFLQTVSAEFVGSQEVFLPNPVTGTKNPEYETGNVYVAGVLESILPVTPCRKWFSQNGKKADNYSYLRIVYSLEILEIARIQETKKYHDTYNARGTFQMGDYSVSSRLVSNLFDGFT